MTRIFWDTIFLISGTFSMSVVLNGCLFTFGAGQSSSAIIEANIPIDTNSELTAAPNTPSNSSVTTSGRSTSTATVAATANIPAVKSSLFTFGARQTNTTIIDATISINTTSTAAPNTSTSSLPATSSSSTTTRSPIATTTTNIHPVKKFVAAAVRSHFDDCPDSHQHFCFHGTCRFLILEETPACVCHPGFVGMRCEHADLLAVVATNHRQQTVATVLVLCVIGCVLIMVLCTLLHYWWRQDCRRQSHQHHYVTEKHRASCYPSESGSPDCIQSGPMGQRRSGIIFNVTEGRVYFALYSMEIHSELQQSELLRMKLPPNPAWEELCVPSLLFMVGLEDMRNDLQRHYSSCVDVE